MRIATVIALVYLPANLVLVRYCRRSRLFVPYLLNSFRHSSARFL